MKKHTDAEKLKAAYNVIDRAVLKPSDIQSVPENLINYLIKSFEDSAMVHGKVKHVATYGGSAFVVFEDEKRYKLNFGLYISELTDEKFV